jgi:hypothetical protein
VNSDFVKPIAQLLDLAFFTNSNSEQNKFKIIKFKKFFEVRQCCGAGPFLCSSGLSKFTAPAPTIPVFIVYFQQNPSLSKI